MIRTAICIWFLAVMSFIVGFWGLSQFDRIALIGLLVGGMSGLCWLRVYLVLKQRSPGG
jgi:hypothetical protein